MKFMPSRNKQKSPSQPPVMVADLDALLTKKVSFKLLGKIHTIDPLTVFQFTNFAAAYGEVLRLHEQEKVTSEELIDVYYNLVASVCDTVSREDISKMTQQQVNGLFQIMVDLHTGRLFADQKKTLEKVESLLSMTPAQS